MQEITKQNTDAVVRRCMACPERSEGLRYHAPPYYRILASVYRSLGGVSETLRCWSPQTGCARRPASTPPRLRSKQSGDRGRPGMGPPGSLLGYQVYPYPQIASPPAPEGLPVRVANPGRWASPTDSGSAAGYGPCLCPRTPAVADGPPA